MVIWLASAALASALSCEGEAATAAARGLAGVQTFHLTRSLAEFEAAASLGCEQARVAGIYLRGWLAAREAASHGGAPASLPPVLAATAQLEALAPRVPGAAIARYVLMAAAAAAQSEREEMNGFLLHAVSLETVQLAAGQPVAPGISAHEAAGDLWLQVHRFDDARAAYTRALLAVGRTPRVTLGLARSAMRLGDTPAACAEYQRLAADWPATSTDSDSPELGETRRYLATGSCSPMRPAAVTS